MGSLALAAGPDQSPACFASTLRRHGLAPLRRGPVKTLQVNVGKRCNQACHHCHVDAGPKRTEAMTASTADRVVALLAASPGVETLDVTGGAPELNPNFASLVERTRTLGRHVMDRCNLTVCFEPGMEWLPEFLCAHAVEVVASLPCYTAENVDRQRGHGVFEKSIAALQRLNRLGYGRPGSPLQLHLVYNPLGASLPPPQAVLEADYKRRLLADFGIEFHRLFTLTNIPIKRFAEQLRRGGEYEAYLGLLVNHFNSAAAEQVMCRSLVSVGWDGTLYDCDFNQMLEIGLAGGTESARTIFDLRSLDDLAGAPIETDLHCFGCTAGAGSSCRGALG